QNSDIFIKPKRMLQKGDRVLYNQARNTLNKEIRAAKRTYAKRLEDQFASNDPASVWKGLKAITNYKTPSPSTEANQRLAEDLNDEDVRQILRKNKRRKAPGPDGVTPACLKTCADQLAPIFSQIFNRSLELCEVPSCFKHSTIIPVPKNPKITGLNDYRPVVLTSVIMKSLEKLVLAYLKDITGPLLEPLQFAYRANRSVDDAVNMGLHFILQHLDRPGTYVRILFVDFSSAFNTIIPTLLQTKLNQLSVPSSISQWITSFLTDRQQLVRMGTFTSHSRTTNTGAPQGCVLSPLLFSLYTNDCTSKDPSVKLLNFADDTTLIGLIQDGEESDKSLNNLELNMLKTVEMIIDFRRNPPALTPLSIMDSTVAAVETFKFLGSVISWDLKWDAHINSIARKGPTKVVLPSTAEEVQPAAGAAETVLLSHHRICSLHINNCLVWLSYKIRHQKITENGSDRREDYWCSPAHPSRTVYIQSEEKGSENHSGSLTSMSSPFQTFAIWSALQSHKYQDSQT
ncbi:hypothetical protein M9458_051234, partial [Cirrhinus mrigala]